VDHEAEKPIWHQVANNLDVLPSIPQLGRDASRRSGKQSNRGRSIIGLHGERLQLQGSNRKWKVSVWKHMCRVPIVIYKITCKMTNKIYIGNTQQNFKKRMTGHFQDVRTLITRYLVPVPDTWYLPAPFVTSVASVSNPLLSTRCVPWLQGTLRHLKY
jgi:hypothetical protein